MSECKARNCDAPPSDNCVGYCARACAAIKIFSTVTVVEGAACMVALTPPLQLLYAELLELSL